MSSRVRKLLEEAAEALEEGAEVLNPHEADPRAIGPDELPKEVEVVSPANFEPAEWEVIEPDTREMQREHGRR